MKDIIDIVKEQFEASPELKLAAQRTNEAVPYFTFVIPKLITVRVPKSYPEPINFVQHDLPWVEEHQFESAGCTCYFSELYASDLPDAVIPGEIFSNDLDPYESYLSALSVEDLEKLSVRIADHIASRKIADEDRGAFDAAMNSIWGAPIARDGCLQASDWADLPLWAKLSLLKSCAKEVP